ncbi:MAG: fused MFS/spermidine synthase [Alphaproteobacteria bacterium]
MSHTRRMDASAATPRALTVPAAVLLIGFTSTLFLSALLLFAVQPMFAKMVLPILGGSPAVWSVAMCFFQAALLGGYAYAHWLNSSVRTPIAVLIHLGVVMMAMLMLPLGIAEGWGHPPEDGLHFWVLALFAVSIGLPFFALAGNSPLLQAWFARTGHKHAQDPYFLYGSSNLGSLLALLSYPILIEPAATLMQQSGLWSLGYKALAVFVGLCGLAMLVSRVPKPESHKSTKKEILEHAPLRQCLVWMGLAFVPSGLLVAVTSHITTDVAAAPFLWVLPLALFLLTFVITFQRKPILSHKAMLALQPIAVAALVIGMQFPLGNYWPVIVAIHLMAFFICAMVSHGELVQRRPKANDLTRFYLWMSLGGALGGLFTGLIAPYIFSTVLEYPIMIVLALLVRPGVFTSKSRTWIREGALVLLLLVLAIGPNLIAGIDIIGDAPEYYIAIFTVLGAAIILARTNPVRLAGLVAVTFLAGNVLVSQAAKGTNYRGFFGVNKVMVTSDGKFRLLKHGTTLHGAQKLPHVRGTAPEPLTYYHREGPFADVIAAARRDHPLKNVGVIGLGTGALSCYRKGSENWKFFEIDPIVVELASDPEKFNFLSECAPNAKLIIGDARLTLDEEPAGRFNLIIVDAFSSDAIPVHLLTREALLMYLSKLDKNGILAFHISNRNMDLRPVLAAAAKDLGLATLTRHSGLAGELKKTYKTPATLVAFARSQSALDTLRSMKDWGPLRNKGWRVWTDDYSNVLGVIMASIGQQDRESKRTSDQ